MPPGQGPHMSAANENRLIPARSVERCNENDHDDDDETHQIPLKDFVALTTSAKDIALESASAGNNIPRCSFGAFGADETNHGEHDPIDASNQPRKPRTSMSIIDQLLFSESNEDHDQRIEETGIEAENVTSSYFHRKEDCPVCFCQMHSSDLTHPLQCPTDTCIFNFCRGCMEHLIVSSKDDYQLASDGSLHVKIHLFCPACRSDLSSTIRDTVLLRKADYVQDEANTDILTASEGRMKSVIDCYNLQDALYSAHLREDRFFKKSEDPSRDGRCNKRDSDISAILVNTESHDEGQQDHVELDLDEDSKSITVKTRTRHRRNRSSIYQLIDEAKQVRAKHRAKRSIQCAATAVRREVGRRLSSNTEPMDTSGHSIRQPLRLRRENTRRSTRNANEETRTRREHRGSRNTDSESSGFFDWFNDMFFQSSSCTTESS